MVASTHGHQHPCNVGPHQLQALWPGNGIPSTAQSRGPFAFLLKGCCRADNDRPPQALGAPWAPFCREDIQHSRVSPCRALEELQHGRVSHCRAMCTPRSLCFSLVLGLWSRESFPLHSSGTGVVCCSAVKWGHAT